MTLCLLLKETKPKLNEKQTREPSDYAEHQEENRSQGYKEPERKEGWGDDWAAARRKKDEAPSLGR